MASVLFEAGINGAVPAQIFYLKTRAGWTERVEVTGRDGSPITLVALREQFAKEIEAKPVHKQITNESES